MNLATAISIAAAGFEGKTDRAGKAYILHCIRVMNNVDQSDEELMIMAILHDVVEDGILTYAELCDYKFSARVMNAINLLTHLDGDNYEDYIKMISFNPDAIAVKLADLKDNSDITRLKGLTKKDFDRMEKYHKAYTYLSQI